VKYWPESGRKVVVKALRSLLLFLFLAISTASAETNIILCVEQNESIWGSQKLYDRLEREITRDQEVRVVHGANKTIEVPFPKDETNFDSLMNWGREIGGRYLLIVSVEEQHLEQRKTFNVPLIFHKYETIGVVCGFIKLIDLQRGRQLLAEPFHQELKGPRILQAAIDGNKNDPDIHLSSPEKLRFFDKLESELAQTLMKRTKQFIKKR